MHTCAVGVRLPSESASHHHATCRHAEQVVGRAWCAGHGGGTGHPAGVAAVRQHVCLLPGRRAHGHQPLRGGPLRHHHLTHRHLQGALLGAAACSLVCFASPPSGAAEGHAREGFLHQLASVCCGSVRRRPSWSTRSSRATWAPPSSQGPTSCSTAAPVRVAGRGACALVQGGARSPNMRALHRIKVVPDTLVAPRRRAGDLHAQALPLRHVDQRHVWRQPGRVQRVSGGQAGHGRSPREAGMDGIPTVACTHPG